MSRRLRIVGIVVILSFLIVVWYRHGLSAVDAGNDARVTVAIPAGASVATIAENLKEEGLIRSAQAFAWHARWTNKDRLVRAGSYALRPSMSADEILLVLTGGAEGELSITIPEGFTIADIDGLMASKGFTATGAIVACAQTCDFSAFAFLPSEYGGPGGRIEGYLYPDTYFVGGEGSDPHAFLSRLLQTFQSKVVTGEAADIASSGKSLHDTMKMASLIEKEAAGDSERSTISGILWKRLDQGIILGVDAAVRYAVNKKPREPLTKDDLETNSRYNLRMQKGLPPGPIANPGLASIKATLKPETTPYFYYLHDKDGRIHYAVTNEEHNHNRDLYLR